MNKVSRLLFISHTLGILGNFCGDFMVVCHKKSPLKNQTTHHDCSKR